MSLHSLLARTFARGLGLSRTSQCGRRRPSHPVALAAQQAVESLEQRVLFSTVQGMVWQDTNLNGTRDSGEPAAAAGVVIYDDVDNLGYRVSGDPSAVTDASGEYQITDLSGTGHLIRIELPAGAQATSPSSGMYNLSLSGDEYNVDFGAAWPPATPAGLNAIVASTTQVDLVWAATTSSYASGYEIQRSEDGGSSWVTITLVTDRSTITWDDSGLTPNTTYAYRIRATASGIDPSDWTGDSVTLPWGLDDGSFESPAVGTGNASAAPSGGFWSFAGTSGIAANGSSLTSANPDAPLGAQAAYLQDGSVSQSAYFPAGTYAVSLLAAQQAGGTSAQSMQVLVDSNLVGTITPGGTGYVRYASDAFTVSAGTHTVQLVGTGGTSDLALLDDVKIAPATPYHNAVLADNPVGYWRLGEATGTSAADASGNGNTGTYLNGVALGGGPAVKDGGNTSALFDGSDDQVTIPDASSLRLTGDLTLEAWVYRTSVGNDWVRVIGKGGADSRNYGLWYTGWQENATILYQELDSAAGFHNYAQTTATIGLNAWHHLAATVSGGTINLYLDGALVGTGTRSHAPATTADPLTIGYAGYASVHRGLIDEAAVYDHALTSEQIQDHVRASNTPPTGLRAAAASGSVSSPWQVTLNWTLSRHHTVQIERSTNGGPWGVVATLTDPAAGSWTDDTVTGRQSYRYRIRGVVDGLPTDWSASVIARTYFTPVFSIAGPASAEMGESYTLQLRAAHANGDVVWHINWGDGSDIEDVTQTDGEVRTSVEHLFLAPGDLPVTATVTDPSDPDHPVAATSLGLDPSFGDMGRVITDVTAMGYNDIPGAVATRPDGRVVVASMTGAGFALAQFNPDGSIDHNFGEDAATGQPGPRTGRTVPHYNGGGNWPQHMTVSPDGKIALAAGIGGDFGVTRYTADGKLDTTFGSAGDVITDAGAVDDQATAQVFQPQPSGPARLIVAGQSDGQMVLVRYLDDGSVDPSFDFPASAVAATLHDKYGDGSYAITRSMAVDRSGRIYVAGQFGAMPWALAMGVVRFNADGSLDTSFGTGGFYYGGVPGAGNNWAHAIAISPDGKAVVAGYGDGNARAFRLTSAGQLDTSFGTAGQYVANYYGYYGGMSFNGVAFQSDGKILLTSGGGYDVTRLNADGTPDTSFGSDGRIHADLGLGADPFGGETSGVDAGSAIPEPVGGFNPDGGLAAIAADGTITGAGMTGAQDPSLGFYNGLNLGIVRLNPNNRVHVSPAPVVSMDLTLVGQTAVTTSLAWTQPTAPAGDGGFDIYRGATKIGSTSGTAYVDTGLTPSTAYQYTVWAKDAAGTPVLASNTVSVTTNAPAFDAVPPSKPAGFHKVSATDSSITLAWNAPPSAQAVVGYEIRRNGVVVGTTSRDETNPGLTFTDEDLETGQSCDYQLDAFDDAGNVSPTATLNGVTTAADSTAPDAPTNLRVTKNAGSTVGLAWNPATDNVAVVGYDVYRKSQSESTFTKIASPTGMAYEDTAATPGSGKTYTYYVVARDAGRTSAASNAQTVAKPVAPPNEAAADDQYVPAAYLNAFYGDLNQSIGENTGGLTQALRDRTHLLGTTAPPAANWLDTGDALFVNGQVSSVLTDDNSHFTDLNGNARFDPDETIASGAADSSKQEYDVPYIDLDNSGTRDPGEQLAIDPQLIHGQAGKLAYRDLDGSGSWGTGETIWKDSTDNSQFDSGETIVYGDAGSLTTGDWGKKRGFILATGVPTDGGSIDLFWQDHTAFRQDFAAFYPAVEQLVPEFADPAKLDDFASARYTLGGLMAKLGVGSSLPSGHGTISLSIPTGQTATSTVVGNGTHFLADMVNGDQILIDGKSYAASATDDTHLSITPAYKGAGVTNAELVVRNWTKVPEATDPTGLTLHTERGRPDERSPLFREQFDELQKVLAALTTRPNEYGAAFYDADTSATLIDVATTVINASTAMYGPDLEDVTKLQEWLEAGHADPGAVQSRQPLQWMQSLIDGLNGEVIARDSTLAGGTASNGWKVEDDFDINDFPGTKTALSFDDAFSDTLLPERTVDGTVVRHEGVWSIPRQNGSFGYEIDPAHLDELSDYVGTLLDNGLWLRSGQRTPTVTRGTSGSLELSLEEGTAPTPPEIPTGGWSGNGTYTDGQRFGAGGYVAATNPSTGLTGAYGNIWAQAIDLSINLPAATNPHGGADLTTIHTGPYNGSISTSGWAWGSEVSVASYTAGAIVDMVQTHMGIAAGLSGSVPGEGPKDGEVLLSWVDSGSLSSTSFSAGTEISFTCRNPEVFGLVPSTPAEPWDYSPEHDIDNSVGSPAAAPTDVLPLTSEMDYRNVIADTDQDDIVAISHDQDSFGPDTGSIQLTALRGTPQVILPVRTDRDGGLPVHAYFAQGGFGSEQTAVGSLRAADSPFASFLDSKNADENGQPLAYSLDTRVQPNVYLNTPANHVKRLEVVRPKGNSVTFDFAWNAAAGEFAAVGLPHGWAGRDASRLYVLRDVTPQDDADFNYDLLFPSGITHQFREVQAGSGIGSLTKVVDTSGVESAATPFVSPTNSRYTLTIEQSAGKISGIDYHAHLQSAGGTIHTDIAYGTGGSSDGAIIDLDKRNGTTAIPEFSYHLSDPTTLDHAGTHVTRSGGAPGTVTLTLTATGTDAPFTGSHTDAYTINNDGLVTAYIASLTHGSTTTSATTSWVYNTSRARNAANQSAMWGQVTKVTYPDESFQKFEYFGSSDTGVAQNTGWLKKVISPWQNYDADASEGSLAVQEYGYTNDTAAGSKADVADDGLLVERPRSMIDKLAGVIVASGVARYHGDKSITRSGKSTSAPTWANTWQQTQAVVGSNGAFTVKGPFSTVSGSSPNALSQTGASSRFGQALSAAGGTTTLNEFLNVVSANSHAAGSLDSSASSVTDGFGRVVTSTDDAGNETHVTYGWFGPTHVETVGGESADYVYTANGRVKTITVGTVRTTFGYDADGNVINTKNEGVGTALVNVSDAAYDVRGRITSFTDAYDPASAEPHRTTGYAYTDGANATATTTYADQTTAIETYRLDGSLASVSGTATTASASEHGVESNGDTWVKSSSNNGNNWSKVYTNIRGQTYKTERSAPGSPGAVAVATTEFDPDTGRPSKVIDFDGTVTIFGTIDPATGKARGGFDPRTGNAITFVDVNRNGVFDYATDKRSVSKPTPGGTTAGATSTSQSDSGVVTATTSAWNHGLNASSTVNGETTSSQIAYTSIGYVVTTTSSDGTKAEQTYEHGLLVKTRTLDTADNPLTTVTYGYDALRRNNSITDWRGTTTFTLRADGSVGEVEYPDGRKTTYGDFDPKTNAPKAVTRPDTQTSNQTLNAHGQQNSVDGAGTYPLSFGYNDTTGQQTSLTTYRSGTLEGSGAATTQWGYDPYTGIQTSRTWADNSQYTSTYNDKFQLIGITKPGITASSFTYNNAGELDASSITDASGTIASSILKRDDRGVPILSQQTTAAGATSAVGRFDALGRPGDIRTGDSGAGVAYEYYGPTENSNGAAPNALKAKVLMKGSTTLQRTEYKYSSTSKRLETVTVKDGSGNVLATYGYTYKPNTDLVASITGPGGTTTLGYESNTGRLSGITASGAGSSPVFGTTINYTPNDQRQSETITRTLASGSGVSYTSTYGYNARNELTSISTSGSGGPVDDSWTYDGVGNRTGYAGGANDLNQYANFVYDARGNLLNDGVFEYTWDALDRLTSATKTDGSVRVEFGYDGSGQRIEKRVYSQVDGEWVTSASQTTKFVYDGQNLVAELDGNNTLLRSYVWAGGTLLAVTDHTEGGPTTYDVISDATGSVVALRAADGTVAANYRYDAWGNLLEAAGPAADVCHIRFALGYADDETGLQYHQARYYSPTQHRWISRDPIAESGGVNVYAYSSNDPVNRVDPSGLEDGTISSAKILVERYYGEKGRRLIQAYEDAGNRIELKTFALESTKSDISQTWFSRNDTIYLSKEPGAEELAHELYKRLVDALSRNDGTLENLYGDVVRDTIKAEDMLAAYQKGIQDGAAVAKAAAEAYYSGISLFGGEGANVVVTVNELHEGNIAALANLVPVLGPQLAKGGKVLIRRGSRLIGAVDEAAVQKLARIGCFEAGTLVATEFGPRAIESVAQGSRVWTIDVGTHQWSLQPVVLPLTRYYDGDFITVEAAGFDGRIATIRSTGNHPYLVVDGDKLESRPPALDVPEAERNAANGGRWVEARSLRVGDRLRQRGGQLATVVAHQSQIVSTVVHNLWVANIHNFAVSDLEVVVHNNQACSKELEKLVRLTVKGRSVPIAAPTLIEGFDFGKHLRGFIGEPPAGMVNPHAHHILFKKGLGAKQKVLVEEGQAILLKVGIDPIYGKENLVWAPYKISLQHGPESLEKVVNKLRELDKVGADYDDFVSALKKLGEEAARRGT